MSGPDLWLAIEDKMSDRLSQKQQYQWRLQRLSAQMQRIPRCSWSIAERDRPAAASSANRIWSREIN